jgi:hypothetical protein
VIFNNFTQDKIMLLMLQVEAARGFSGILFNGTVGLTVY